MKRFGLIGYPLTHSFSKKFFTEKFAKEGLNDHVYELFPIESVSDLPGILEKYPDLLGLNVTIPYKQLVLKYLDSSYLPENILACNCIKINKGRMAGYNTDVIGFEESFFSSLSANHKKALVLGNGGATAAVTYVFRKLGIAYQIVSRKLHDGSTLTYDDLDEKIIRDHKIIINTTPLGTFPDVNVCPPLPYGFISHEHYLFDLVYNPSKTLFLHKGEERGATIKNGYDMLVIQAKESWKIWNESTPSIST